MKLFSIVLCLAFILSLLFSGCTTNNKYQVLEFEYSDSINSASHTLEYSYWNNTNIDVSNVKPSTSINVNGQAYQGTYHSALMLTPNTYPVYQYLDSKGRFFSVDPDGQLTSYIWGEPTNVTGSPKTLTQQECQDIALQFLGTYVETDQYRIKATHDTEPDRYTFTFTKYINDHKTADTATISILHTGEFYTFTSCMLGKIPINTEISFDLSEVNTAINSKIDSIYASAKKQFDRVEHSVVTQYVTILESGELALICYVDVDCITDQGDSYISTGDRVGLIVKLK